MKNSAEQIVEQTTKILFSLFVVVTVHITQATLKNVCNFRVFYFKKKTHMPDDFQQPWVTIFFCFIFC